MSLIVYATKIMNFYCGFQLTWKTCETFKKSTEEIGDQLLIKWFLLYSFIQLEGMLLLFLELIPFGFLMPFFIKSYIMLPHSRWHQLIYSMFEKLEMDEYSNAYTIYITKFLKSFLVRFLLIIENCVDLVRVEDLNEIEIQVANIAQKIMMKKQSIEVRQSKLKIRKSEPKQQQQNKDFLSVQASVKDHNSFKDYTIVFNCHSSEVSFVQNNECVHRKTLLLIDLDKEKCLKAQYAEDDGNLQLIKLKRSEDIDLWLKPVIEILIQKVLLNCLDLSQQIAKLIFQKRYKQKVDMNFNIECNMIRKKWNAHGDNNLAIQFYLKKQMKSYLVEEWNILSNQQQVNESAQNFIEKCLEMTYQTPLQKKSDNEIDHILHLNETKKSDWLDPEQIATLQVTLNHKLTVNVAFLQKYDLIEQVASESINEFKSFKRDRFLSDDYHNETETRVRKTSYHDLESLRQYKKNQAIITQARNRANDSFSSTSSKNKSNQLLTIINKKDDVEILSSAEDAQKIIDQDENGDFEIQMIIDEQPVEKGQTIIINQKMSPITNLILKIREKKHQYSSQLVETLSFIKNYT